MGRGSTATLGGGIMPKIHSVEPWDGNDGQVSGMQECYCCLVRGKSQDKVIL